MFFQLGGGDQCLDEPQGTCLDGLGQAQWLGFVLHGPGHGVRPREPRRHRDGLEDGKAPGGDVDELDLVTATAPTPYSSFVAGLLPDLRAAAMRDGHLSRFRRLPLLTIRPPANLVRPAHLDSCRQSWASVLA
ncbi:hypothetical protein [Streptomyces lavendulae]|uniref:hypothetical protein n=1 Tax=Streptomyces lavendulae TaxID=1914 RepID=UPI0033C99CE6